MGQSRETTRPRGADLPDDNFGAPVSSIHRRRAADHERYIGWSHLPRGGEIGVIESVEVQGTVLWLQVRLADDTVERRAFVPGLDHLIDERAFAAESQ